MARKKKAWYGFPQYYQQLIPVMSLSNHHLNSFTTVNSSKCFQFFFFLQNSYIYCTFPQHLALSIIFRANSFPVDLWINRGRPFKDIHQRHHPSWFPLQQTLGRKTGFLLYTPERMLSGVWEKNTPQKIFLKTHKATLSVSFYKYQSLQYYSVTHIFKIVKFCCIKAGQKIFFHT